MAGRNYKSEYKNYQGRPDQIHKRSERNHARLVVKKAGVNVSGKDVDHIKPLDKGGSNKKSNLRVVSKHSNRSFPRTKHADMKIII